MAAIWGLTFPLVRGAVQSIDAISFVAWRFAAALGIFLLLLPVGRSSRDEWRRAALPGIALGLVMWVAYSTETVGLESVPSTRAAFLAASSVVIVPLLSPLFEGRRPPLSRLGEAVLALAGIALLVDSALGRVGSGEAWILVCALVVALHVHLLQRSIRAGLAARPLAFFQTLGVALPSLAFTLPRGLCVPRGRALFAVFYCAVLATVVVFLLQLRYQGCPTPERAALLYATEPFFAALFGCVLLKETFTPRSLAGALMLAVAIALQPASHLLCRALGLRRVKRE